LNRKELNEHKIEQTLRENGLGDNDQVTIANIRRAIAMAMSENNEVIKEETVDKTIWTLLNDHGLLEKK
jgi:hypothetical protein